MTTYHAYIIKRVKAFLLFLFFFFVATFILLFFAAQASTDSRTALLFFFFWPGVIYASYALSLLLTSAKFGVTVYPDHIVLENRFRRTRPLQNILLQDISHCSAIYGSVGCVSITLHMANGSKITLSRRLIKQWNAAGFDELVAALENLLSSDATGELNEDGSLSAIGEEPIITCKTRIEYTAGIYISPMLTILNIMFVLLVFSSETISGKPIFYVAIFILLGIGEIALVTWIFILLSSSKLTVTIYKNKVVVRQLKNYIIQRYTANEIYFKDVIRYIVMWTRGNSEVKTVKLTNKNRTHYYVEESTKVASTSPKPEYQIEKHLSAAIKQFIAETDIPIAMKHLELEPDNDDYVWPD